MPDNLDSPVRESPLRPKVYRIDTKRKRYLVFARSRSEAAEHLWEVHNEPLIEQRITNVQHIKLPLILKREDLPHD